MPVPIKVQIAQEKMLQAEGALEAYLERGIHNPEEHRQLASALREAINEHIDAVASEAHWPPTQK